MSDNNHQPNLALHDDVLAVLPWFCNGTLSHEQNARVDAHVKTCLTCRRELEMLRALAEHVAAPQANDECELALRKLAQRLDAQAAPPRQIPWAAVAMLAIVTSMSAWVAHNAEVSTAWLRNAGFSMRAVPELVEPVALGPQVNLMFYDDITERQMRSLVLAVGAVVVEGPTPQGVYKLAFLRQMSPGELMAALRHLRFSRDVVFAEPAGSASLTTKVSDARRW